MRQIILKEFIFFLTFIFHSCISQISGDTEKNISIIPQPYQIIVNTGEFSVGTGTQILSDNESKEAGRFLSELLTCEINLNLDMNRLNDSQTQMDAIVIQTVPELAENLGDEGYTLQVDRNGIKISAATNAGHLYGIQTLRQLFPVLGSIKQSGKNGAIAIPFISIEDKPRFRWRGFMLDVSRHFLPKSFIKKVINHLVFHKMNVFHWHLVDDQGWRIEIKKYPKLTEVGAWRVDREHQHWNAREMPGEGEKPTYGGYYTQGDIREIVSYAESLHVTIVPEIEMPAHVQSALAAYPEYSCTGGPFTVAPGGVAYNQYLLCRK